MFRSLLTITCSLAWLTTFGHAADEVPDYSRDVAPILQKHCAGCHNADDAEGKFSVESFASLQKGGEHGPAFAPEASQSSRMIQMVTGKLEPIMPPDGLDLLNEREIAVLVAWVDSGAKGPSGAVPDRTMLRTPKLPPAKLPAEPITALAWSPDDALIAIGRFGRVELRTASDRTIVRELTGLPGKVTGLQFSADGRSLIAASGVTGLYGLAARFDVATGEELTRVQGHRDILYAARMNRDATVIATAGYDRTVILWDAATGEKLRTLTGHNGAIYDLAFSPDGTLLATASGDETVKVWETATGRRFDTLGQPQGEQFSVTFTPDGKRIIAAGADNRIRVWNVLSTTQPRINPLRFARFAHEGGIVELCLSADGKRLVSFGDDRTMKLWDANRMVQLADLEPQATVVQVAVSNADSSEFLVARMNGSLDAFPFKVPQRTGDNTMKSITAKLPQASDPMATVTETEPNDTPETATPQTLPATIKGTIAPNENAITDADLYRIAAKEGEQWVIEVNAARSKSPLDSLVEVLDADGRPIERVLLQAVRDSYFTFRGKDSNTSDDFRVFNWEEMELDQFFYAQGEVVKLWHYPRGPDSGFRVYPGFGRRHTFFDTTPLAHALHEPAYIVRAHAPGTTIIPNGLPIFPIYYINDDDSQRKWGADSRLTFTAPADGDYLVRITDARGSGGADHSYTLTIRPRKPDFNASLNTNKLTVRPGNGAEFEVRLDRLDDFEREVTLTFENVPEGYHVPSPISVMPGQYRAYGNIVASMDAKLLTPEQAKQIVVTARGEVAGQTITKPVKAFESITLKQDAKLRVHVESKEGQKNSLDEPLTLTIHPGETIDAFIEIERNGVNAAISFGKDDAGRNLPHGVFVDNIGLNGLLIPAGQTRRRFFITASPIAKPMTRTFHLRATADGNPTSLPIRLHVVPK